VEKTCLGNRRYLLWVAALGLPLPGLGGEAERQLDAEGCASSCVVVWGFCTVVDGFLLVVMLCASWEKGGWR